MANNNPQTQKLLKELTDQPDDLARRERAARALLEDDRADEAVKLLRERLVHLNRHEKKPPLPCLCPKCFKPAASLTDDGATYHLEFAIADGRVLYYWLPAEILDQRSTVSNSVRGSLQQHFQVIRRKWRLDRPKKTKDED